MRSVVNGCSGRLDAQMSVPGTADTAPALADTQPGGVDMVDDTRPVNPAPNPEVRARCEAARQLLSRLDELGDRFCVEHALALLIAAWGEC